MCSYKCIYIVCSDIDICEADNGGCSHKCTDLDGLMFVCECPVNMALLPDKKNCKGISHPLHE